jgi:hypothetical protein
MIYTRAIVQYVEPFSSVRLSTMAAAFSTDDENILREVEGLVVGGSIQGKIDLIDNVSGEDDTRCSPTFSMCHALGWALGVSITIF